MLAEWRPSSAASRHLLPASGEKALPAGPSSAAARHLLPAGGEKALPAGPSSAAARHLLPAGGEKGLTGILVSVPRARSYLSISESRTSVPRASAGSPAPRCRPG